jgi:hypothetical protein
MINKLGVIEMKNYFFETSDLNISKSGIELPPFPDMSDLAIDFWLIACAQFEANAAELEKIKLLKNKLRLKVDSLDVHSDLDSLSLEERLYLCQIISG